MSGSLDAIDSALYDVGAAPRKVEVDGQRIEEHDLGSLIQLDKYLSGKQALNNPAMASSRGLRFNRIRPPNAMGDQRRVLGPFDPFAGYMY